MDSGSQEHLMAAVVKSLWFLMLLSPALCEGDRHLEQDKESPITNLKLDPRKKMLTWKYSRAFTDHRCSIDTPLDPRTHTTPQTEGRDTFLCRFPNALLYRGATLTLRVTSQGREFQEVLQFRNVGKEGSRATNFSCFIYDLRFMNCSWARGPAAPRDVQYHLYFWFSRDDNETECAQYICDSEGVHVGCHFDDLGEPKRTDNYFFLLNGTSREEAIQFVDFAPVVAFKIEKYNPPANLTVRSNGSHLLVRWDNPGRRFALSSSSFVYQLDIRSQSGSLKRDPVFQNGQDENVYVLPSSDSKSENTVRMRVRYQRNDIWSDWTDTVHFGFQEGGYRSSPGTLVPLVVGAAALSAAVLMVVCKRYSLCQRLCPPIPEVKREVTEVIMCSQEITWVEAHPAADPQEPEEVVAVEETRVLH